MTPVVFLFAILRFLIPLSSSKTPKSIAFSQAAFSLGFVDLCAVFFFFLAMLYGILIIVVVYGAYLFVRWRIRTIRADACLSDLPSPKGEWPIFGHALQLASGHPWSTFAGWASAAGHTVRANILGTRVVYTSEPKFIRRILQTNQRNYPKDLQLSYFHFLCLLGTGLVTSEGEDWKRGRVLLSHAFRFDILHEIPAISLSAVQRLMKKFEQGGKDGTFDLSEEFRHLTLQVIAEAILSLSPEETDKNFAPLYLPIVTEANKRVWSPWRRFLPIPANFHRSRCLTRLNSYITNLVNKRWALRQTEGRSPPAIGTVLSPNARKAASLASTRQEDLLDHCLSNIHQWNLAVSDQIRDDVKTFLLAGHETSAAMLTWAIYQLTQNKLVADALLREHKEVFEAPALSSAGKDGQAALPSLEALKALKWAPAILRECLRMYSVVPMVPRKADEDDVIPAADCGQASDLIIPQGTVLMVGIDGVHSRPDLWPQPTEFRPQRFFDMSTVDEFSFIPFIAGPRNCLGQHLSLLESSVVLSFLNRNWTFELAREDEEANPKSVHRHDFIVPLAPSNGLLVRAVPRKNGADVPSPTTSGKQKKTK